MTPTFVLYCAELPAREKGCRDHLAEKGVPATFWRGYHGKTWGLETRLEYAPGLRLPPGHVALNVGSYAMWQHAYLSLKEDDDCAVLLEDDAVLPDLFPLKLSSLQIELRYCLEDWDLVFLGLAEAEPHVWQKVTDRIGKPNSQLCRLNDPFGTHAMMIRKRGLAVMLDKMTKAERNLDQQLWEYVLKPGLLKWCALLPSMVTQRTFDYAGSGKPEWQASTVDFDDQGKPLDHFVGAKEHELKMLFGTHDDHHEEKENSKPPEEYVKMTAQLIDPFPCIYRGEFTDDLALNDAGRSVPLSVCARFNKPCYTRPDFVAVEPKNALRCQTCTYRTEMASDSPRTRLPLPEGHFNPSMIQYNGRTILATRDSWGHSKVALWELTNPTPDWTGDWAVTPIGSYKSDHSEAPRLEDPRLFLKRDPQSGEDRLCAMFNLPDGYPPKLVQVGYMQFDKDLTKVEYTQIYRSPHGNAYEKNWVPFCNEYGLNWVYASKPEHVVMCENGETYKTPNHLPWTGGFMRGGASPVYVPAFAKPGKSPVLCSFADKDVFYHFFHGCHKRVHGSVYTTGCAVFEAKPPYRVLRQTITPLIWPDLPGHGEDVVKRYVIWPGGVIPHAGAWHVCLGVDDTFCRIDRIPFEKIEAALNNVPEERKVTSLRDTEIATGARKE